MLVLLRRGAGLGALALAVLPAAPTAALVITPSYGTSVTSSANAAAIEADFGTVVAHVLLLHGFAGFPNGNGSVAQLARR